MALHADVACLHRLQVKAECVGIVVGLPVYGLVQVVFMTLLERLQSRPH